MPMAKHHRRPHGSRRPRFLTSFAMSYGQNAHSWISKSPGNPRSTVSEQILSVSVRLCETHVSEFALDSLRTRLHSSGPEALMQPRLLIISGSRTGTIRPLIDGNVSIGLDESNQLSLVDTVVSREHCTIERVGTQYEVADRDSPGGTFVNGIPVRRKVLDHGDKIHVGNFEVMFLLHEGEGAGTSQIMPERRGFLLFTPGNSSGRSGVSSNVCGSSRMDGTRSGCPVQNQQHYHSIRDSELLQHELLRLIFEVIPAGKRRRSTASRS